MDILGSLQNLTPYMKAFGIILLVAFVTVILQNAYDTRKELVRRKENYDEEQEMVFEILNEIKLMQQSARTLFEMAESDHDRAKALYAYQQISDCLKRFEPLKSDKKENS